MHFRDLARPVEVPYGSTLYGNLCANKKWIAQEKVDGMRVLARNDTLVSRHGKVVEPGKELAAAMRSLPCDWEFDCELANGILWVFDLVRRESPYKEPIVEMPLSYRLMVLKSELVPSSRIQNVRTSTNVERAWGDWVTGMGAEGIVLKCLGDMYPPRKGGEWYKVKP